MRTRSQIRRSLAESSRGSNSGDGAAPVECEPRPLLQRCCRLDPSRRSCTGSETQVSHPILGLAPFIYSAESYLSKKRARRRPADPAGSSIHDNLGEETEWRDWSSLEAGIVEDIAGRLLSLDVAEYLRLRAACKSWRTCTADPRAQGGGLDPRFRPRDWIAMTHCAAASSSSPPSRLTLLNVATGARVGVDFPEELSTHHHIAGSSADGLLVLCDKTSHAIRLLNPLTRALVEFPAITDARALTVTTTVRRAKFHFELGSTEVHVLEDPPAIKGAGIDDSTSPPTLVLCMRMLSHVCCAKPGDGHWASVHYGEQRESVVTALGRILFQSMVSFRGRCFFTTPRGDIMTLDLGPMTYSYPWSPLTPRMVYLHREMALGEVKGASYLVRCHNADQMLLVRYSFSRHGDLAITDGDGNPVKTFLSRGAPSRMEVSEVDIDGRRLIPLQGIGDDAAVFVGNGHSIMVSTAKFPKMAANTVYMNYLWQQLRCFGTYRFGDGTTTLPRDLRRNNMGRDTGFSPCVCHLELDDYLICHVEQPEEFHNRPIYY